MMICWGSSLKSLSTLSSLSRSRSSSSARRSISAAATDSHPIVLLARLKIKPEKRAAFLDFARPLNEAEQQAKPGTLIFTLNQDPADKNGFTWTEVQHACRQLPASPDGAVWTVFV